MTLNTMILILKTVCVTDSMHNGLNCDIQRKWHYVIKHFMVLMLSVILNVILQNVIMLRVSRFHFLSARFSFSLKCKSTFCNSFLRLNDE